MKISREALAKELGVAPNTLFRWEKNHREPSDDVKWKIAEILDADIAWLMGAGDSEEGGGNVMKMTKLISLRKSRKMTQEEMSKLIGVSSRTYASWEAGVSEMRASDLRKISEVLEIPMENIFNDTPDPVSPTEEPTPHGRHTPHPQAPHALCKNIEIEIELPNKSKVRFSIPPDTDEDKICKLITHTRGG